MKAPICIAAVSTSGVRTGAVIKGNIFKHANTPILLRNVVCDVADNNMSPYLQGYYHGIGNAPELNAGIVLQFPNTSTASSLKIRSNSMVGGLMGVAIIDAPRFDFTKNDIYIRYKRDAALGIISQLFSGTTDTVRVNVTDNQFDNAAGYDPTISGFVNMSTPVNGTIVTQNNISTPVDFMSFNFVSTSGAGAITQRGGIRGGGSFVWNPGTIANGTTHVTTVTGLQNTTGLYYEVTPPYNMQGCQVFAYSYYDGAFILKLAISNTTGASVTFGSGTFNLRGIRISP
jgi:hypothetical protein